MRILHTSDWHLGRSLEGRSRLPEQELFVDELVDIVIKENIQLILVAGDVFDTYNPSADAESLFFDTLERLSDGAKRAVVVIAGNHDSPDRLQAANPLAIRHGISILGYPGEQLAAGIAYGGVQRIKTGPGWMELAIPGCDEKAVVYALPYPSEVRLNEILTDNLDDVSQQLAYSERIGQLFAVADYIYRPDTVNLAAAHFFAFGGVESESERQLGGALAVSPKVMPKKAQYMALGHLHRPQQIHNALQACRYSGSPLSFSFSEADQQKEVVVVDAIPGGLARVNPIKLTSGKALKRWRANNIGEARAWCAEPNNLECWVELEILVDSPIDVSELAELRKAHSGIITIRPIFPDLDDQAARLHQLSKMSLEERFSIFFQRERGISPQEELVRFFLEMVNQQGTDDCDVMSNTKPTESEVG